LCYNIKKRDNFTEIKPKNIDNPTIDFQSMTKKEIKQLINSSIKTINEKEHVIQEYISSKIRFLKDANTITTFDIEFAEIDGKKQPIEFGISTYDKRDDSFNFYHLIITDFKGQYDRPNTPIEHQEMYSYGKSTHVNLITGLQFFKNKLEESDTCVSYTHNDRLKFMKEHDMSDIKFLNLQSLTQLLVLNDYTPSLAKFAHELHNGNEQPINNAGNDSALTMEILKSTVGDIIGINAEFNSCTDYSNNPRKMSAIDIQTIRQIKNNNPLMNPMTQEDYFSFMDDQDDNAIYSNSEKKITLSKVFKRYA
jgi:hypothetical protein